MVDIETFKKIALSFQGTEERLHFDRIAFKVRDRKIFATLHEKSQTANIIFSKNDQSVYCSFDETAVYPVPNKFGLQGWTTFELKKVPIELISDALVTAYRIIIETKPRKKRYE